MGSSGDELPRPVVIAGPSGSGKSTLYHRLFEENPDLFAFSVSHTTRSPRPGEIDGKDYHFVTLDEMKDAISKGEFIEHAVFSGNTYGTSKRAIQDVQKTGRICFLDIDMQGVKSVKCTDLNCLYIFIKPPSLKTLENRLRGRGTETEEAIQKRLDTARAELVYADEEGTYDHTIVNDDLEKAYLEFVAVLRKNIPNLEQRMSFAN